MKKSTAKKHLCFLGLASTASYVFHYLGYEIPTIILASSLVVSFALVMSALFMIKQFDQLFNTSERGKHVNEPRIAIRLLKLIIPSNAEQQNVIGDLIEEFDLFESKPKAYVWFYKQLIISACPLIWRTLKYKLASVFSERVR